MVPVWQRPPRAVYLHVPFCRRRCGYCNFTLVAGRSDLIQPYLDSIDPHDLRECPVVGRAGSDAVHPDQRGVKDAPSVDRADTKVDCHRCRRDFPTIESRLGNNMLFRESNHNRLAWLAQIPVPRFLPSHASGSNLRGLFPRLSRIRGIYPTGPVSVRLTIFSRKSADR